jgi:hypothetical protein
MMMGGNILALNIEYRIRSLMPIASKYDLGTVFIKNFVISDSGMMLMTETDI